MSKVNLNILVVLCALIMALAGPAGADTLIVDASGGGDFYTIHDAIIAAGPFYEIEVWPGTYNEAIDFLGKPIRLYSKDGPKVTTIDGTGYLHVVQCISGEDANTILEGFTITGGNANGTLPPSRSGGGMLNYNNSSPTVTNCIFNYNTADSKGGGMYNGNNSNPVVTNCAFIVNWADYGGGMSNYSSSPTVTNCSFSENESMTPGNGDGMSNESGSNPTVKNCIFWNGIWGTTGQIYSDGMDPLNVSYSDVQYLYLIDLTGPNNIDADPLFLDPFVGDLRLSSLSSPCVDAGDNSAPGLPATDLAGNPRIVDGDQDDTAIVDMGAYELPPALLIHNITQDIWYGGNDTIQMAIVAANGGDEIEVLPGTYNEAINFIGRAITLRSSDPNDPNIVAATVIDGTGNYHVVQCVMGEEPNTVLSGFTITGGNANGDYPDDCGGGMYNEGSNPTVTNCTFISNIADSNGGGMHNSGSIPTVTNCTFSSNTVGSAGGGICNWNNSSPTVTNCTFSGNIADVGGGMTNYYDSIPMVTNCTFSSNTVGSAGGGMHNFGSSPTVTNCTFSGNSVTAWSGGGMSNTNSSPMVTNCTFSDNSATTNGGGMYNNNSSPTVTNCTFTGNTAQGYGGGMFNVDSSYPTVINSLFNQNMAQQSHGGGMANYNSSNSIVINCTFSGNSALNGEGGGMRNWASDPEVTNCILWGNLPEQISDSSSSSVVSYSDIQGGYAGTENIDADPCFVNPDSNDFHLLPDSPCIDAGDSTGLWQMRILEDMDGKIRYFDISGVTDTGTGPVTFIDMGAYELQCSGIAGDNNCDGVVNFKDLAIICNNWLFGAE